MSTATVVGAGVFGASTASELARRGWDVTLVEQYTPGHVRSASGGDTRLIRFAHGEAEWYSRLALRALELWRELEAESGARLFEQVGVAWFGTGDGTFLDDSEATLTRLGVPCERLTPEEARRALPLARRRRPPLGAVRAGRGRDLRAAGDAGARPRAARSRRAAPTRASRRATDVVVWACGAWLPTLFPGHVELRVSRRDVFFLGVDGAWAGRPGFCDYDDGFYGHGDLGGFGMKVAPDRAGDRVDPDTLDRTPLESNERLAREYAARRFPALADAPVIGARVCQYTLTGDTHFLVAPHPERAGLVARRRRLGPRLQARAGARRVRRRLHRGPLRAGAVPRARPARGSGRDAHDDRRAVDVRWRSSSSTPRTSAARSGRTSSREELVERARAWAEREGHELLVVFDGDPPEDAPDLVGLGLRRRRDRPTRRARRRPCLGRDVGPRAARTRRATARSESWAAARSCGRSEPEPYSGQKFSTSTASSGASAGQLRRDDEQVPVLGLVVPDRARGRRRDADARGTDDLDHLVVQLELQAAAEDEVELLLRAVVMAVRALAAGVLRHPPVRDGDLLGLERPAHQHHLARVVAERVGDVVDSLDRVTAHLRLPFACRGA